MKMPLVMDGTTYRVAIVYDTILRHFELVEGPNAEDMMSGRHERDLLGTRFSYQLQVEADRDHPEDYDAFYNAITDPNVPNHTITLPFGQSTITYEAQIISGDDLYKGPVNGYKRYTGLVVNYSPTRLQRVST